MTTLSCLALRTSLIAASVSLASVVAVAPAQAIQLSGSLGISGDLDIENTDDGFIWEFSENVVNDQFGDFADISLSEASLPEISALEFICDEASPISMCTTDAVTSFINFGEQTINGITSDLTFNLDAAEYMSWGNEFTGTTTAFPNITGAFIFEGETLAMGNFSGGYAGKGETYQMTLTSVPEPATALGLGLTVGLAGLMRRKNSGQSKNQKQA
jgi:hypothetical protein